MKIFPVVGCTNKHTFLYIVFSSHRNATKEKHKYFISFPIFYTNLTSTIKMTPTERRTI